MMTFLKKYALAVLILFHVVGLVGISFIDRDFFAALTPLNLLLSLFLMALCHQGSRPGFVFLLGLTFLLGFLVELLGTRTGLPFGDYQYLTALGPKLAGVPLIIGVNWFLMTMGSGFLTRLLTKNSTLGVLLAAVLMTLTDLAIEPLAPVLGYWKWAQGQAPLMNYLGWLAVSVVMQLIFIKTMHNHTNRLAIPYFICVSLFFVILNFTV